MKVSDIMNRSIQTIQPSTSVFEAAKLMKDGDFGVLPVVDGQRLVGMLTDRDIAIRFVAEKMDQDTEVQEIMTPDTITCMESDDINQAAFIMGERQIRRIIVMDAQNRISGIVSLADIAKHSATVEHAENVLSEVSQPTHNEPGANVQSSDLHH
jgi:CBS domain-containing protein